MEPERLQLLKRHLTKRAYLSYYCLAFSLLLSLSALNGFKVVNLFAFLLTLPVLIYFFLAAAKQTMIKRQFWLKYAPEFLSVQQQQIFSSPRFSIKQFLLQPSWAFRFNLLLLLLIIFTILSKNHPDASSISYVN